VEHGASGAAGDHRGVQQPRLRRPAQPRYREDRREQDGAEAPVRARLPRQPRHEHASIAKGFGVDAEVAQSPEELRAALSRARKATVEGKPYLIDAQVARVGVAWADKPWIPPISIARERTRKV